MHAIFSVSRRKIANCCHIKFVVIYQNKLTLQWKSTLFLNTPGRNDFHEKNIKKMTELKFRKGCQIIIDKCVDKCVDKYYFHEDKQGRIQTLVCSVCVWGGGGAGWGALIGPGVKGGHLGLVGLREQSPPPPLRKRFSVFDMHLEGGLSFIAFCKFLAVCLSPENK